MSHDNAIFVAMTIWINLHKKYCTCVHSLQYLIIIPQDDVAVLCTMYMI